MKRMFIVAALVTTTAACSSSAREASTPTATPSSDGAAITIAGFTYKPATLRVPAGTTVTWTNTDQILHTATSGTPGAPTGVFDGTMPAAGERFSETLRMPGTYKYFCSRHEGMRGEIVVEG